MLNAHGSLINHLMSRTGARAAMPAPGDGATLVLYTDRQARDEYHDFSF